MPKFDPREAGVHWTRLDISGPDAEDFLQRVSTVDLRALAPGEGAPGFILSATGGAEACFWLWRLAPSEFTFELDARGGWLDRLRSTLDRLTFGERYELHQPAFAPVWELGEARPGGFDHGTRDFGEPWRTRWLSEASRGGEILEMEHAAHSTLTSFRRSTSAPRESMSIDLDLARVGAIRPWFGREILPGVNPLDLGLGDFVAANKGCYPGQEVIERIRSLGEPARRLARVEWVDEALSHGTGGGAPRESEGAELLADGGAKAGLLGTQTGAVGLAVLGKRFAVPGTELRAGARRCVVRAIADWKGHA